MTKICSHCKQNLPLTSFTKCKKAKDGLQWHCIECNRQMGSEWFKNNRANRIIQILEYRKNNPDKVKKWRKGLSQQPHIKEYYKNYAYNYRRLHPERIQATEKKRNQTETRKHDFRLKDYRRKGSVGSHTLDEWLDILKKYNYTCYYCSAKATTREHKIPLIRGGTNFIDNIVPACFSCNASKGSKTDLEFIAWKHETNKRTKLQTQLKTN